MHAYDADNGRAALDVDGRPAAGAAGRQHVAAATDRRHYGGGSMWESPVVDTKRGLAIFGTGNPNPWNSRGPGKNLWTDSIVALNLYTGQLVWGYQTTHHDLWDSDLPNNGVMFDAKYKVPTKVTVKVKYKKRIRVHGKFKTVIRTKKVKRTKLVLKTRPGVAFVNKHGHDLHPRS